MVYNMEEHVFSNCKMRSFQSFREQCMWIQNFSSKMVHTHIQQMSSQTSCMMCLVAVFFQIDFQSTLDVNGPGHHVHWT